MIELDLAYDRPEEAVAEGQRMAALDPQYSYFDDSLAAAYRESGRLDESIALYEESQRVTHVPRAGLAITYARAGRPDDARRTLDQILDRSKRQYVAADSIASVYVALGDFDEAFRWLDRSIEEHSAPLEGLRERVVFRPLRNDPRFAEVLRRIGVKAINKP